MLRKGKGDIAETLLELSQIVVELEAEQAEYQRLHRKYHGEEDLRAKHNHGLMRDLCDKIRKSLERK